LKAIEIMELLNKWALPSLIDNWDNTGFQIGDPEKEIEKVLISLDLDRKVFQKAIEEKAQMIITHHPIIFKPIKSITKLNYKEKLIYDIIKEDIVVYNAHTNLDLADNGVNDTLAKVLGIKKIEPLKNIYEEVLLENKDKSYGYGRIGEIEKTSLFDYLDEVKKKLEVESLIVYGNMNRNISKVAVCGGSGGSFIYDAYLKGAHVYITGDIKYHEAQYANELGLTIVDGGHYHTEKVILPVIKEYLEKGINKTIDIRIYNQSSPPYVVY
jgi:dinuclear metal center YbgI/SA1388 family protein